MQLKKLLDEMRTVLLEVGVPAKQINIRTESPKPATLLKAFDWLHDIKISPQWDKFMYAWNLLPGKTWRQYKILEIEGLREQLILESAKKALLSLWKTKRPQIFGTKLGL